MKSITFSIRIPQTLLDAIKRRAEKENRSINNLIGTILKKEFKDAKYNKIQGVQNEN